MSQIVTTPTPGFTRYVFRLTTRDPQTRAVGTVEREAWFPAGVVVHTWQLERARDLFVSQTPNVVHSQIFRPQTKERYEHRN